MNPEKWNWYGVKDSGYLALTALIRVRDTERERVRVDQYLQFAVHNQPGAMIEFLNAGAESGGIEFVRWLYTGDDRNEAERVQTEYNDTHKCPNCEARWFYVTTWCNFAHCLACGHALDSEHEECWILPEAIRAEFDGDIRQARQLLQNTPRNAFGIPIKR